MPEFVRVSLAFMGIPQTIQFASLGMADSLILMVLALVVFGPRRLPQIGRQIGKLMYEFRKASNDFKFQMEEELRNAEESDRRKKEEERLKALSLAAPAVETPAPDAQTAEAGAATPTASPYPWESVYPPVTEPAVAAPVAETQPEEASTPPEEASTPPEESSLQVQPPSTGETVAAAPPKRIRRKRTVKPAAVAESDTAATEQPVEKAAPAVVADSTVPTTEPSQADVSIAEQPGSEQSGTIPEQAHNG
jgi:sec-independent protein translocase protein TatB